MTDKLYVCLSRCGFCALTGITVVLKNEANLRFSRWYFTEDQNLIVILCTDNSVTQMMSKPPPCLTEGCKLLLLHRLL